MWLPSVGRQHVVINQHIHLSSLTYTLVSQAAYSDECGEYDPRVRPWYVASSSGPKDVVIVMDISASMMKQGRLELAKDAVASVLGTMNANTFVNVVLFSNTVWLSWCVGLWSCDHVRTD